MVKVDASQKEALEKLLYDKRQRCDCKFPMNNHTPGCKYYFIELENGGFGWAYNKNTFMTPSRPQYRMCSSTCTAFECPNPFFRHFQ